MSKNINLIDAEIYFLLSNMFYLKEHLSPPVLLCILLQTAICFFTGVIYTELCRNLSPWLQLLMVPMAKLLLLDPEGGSQTTLHCTLQEGIEPLSGRYFSSCALQEVGAKGRDDALARKLWEVSERLSGLS